jgi:hypothetical protein
VWLEGLGKLRKSSYFIGDRTRDLPACSILLQPTMLPLAQRHEYKYTHEKAVVEQSVIGCLEGIKYRTYVANNVLSNNGTSTVSHQLLK